MEPFNDAKNSTYLCKFIPLLCVVAFMLFGVLTQKLYFWKIWHQNVPTALYLPNIVELTRAVPIYYAISISYQQPYTRIINTVISIACALVVSVPDDIDGSIARHSNGTSKLGDWYDHTFFDDMYNYVYIFVFWNFHRKQTRWMQFGLLIFTSKAGFGAYPLQGLQYLVPCFSPPLINAAILAIISAIKPKLSKYCAIFFAMTLCVAKNKQIFHLDSIFNNIFAS